LEKKKLTHIQSAHSHVEVFKQFIQNSIIMIIDGAGDACFGQIFRIFGI
jgi:hypothetical protein